MKDKRDKEIKGFAIALVEDEILRKGTAYPITGISNNLVGIVVGKREVLMGFDDGDLAIIINPTEEIVMGLEDNYDLSDVIKY